MNDNPNDKGTGLLQRLKARGIKEPPLDLSSIYRVFASARWSPDEADTDDDAGQKPERAAVVQPERERELLLLDDAAAYLNVTDDQVSAFVADGTLDYINVGRGTKRPRYRFTKQDLDAFIDRRRQKEVECRSTKNRTPRSITSTSNTKVIGFTARRAAQLAGKPKPSKP